MRLEGRRLGRYRQAWRPLQYRWLVATLESIWGVKGSRWLRENLDTGSLVIDLIGVN